jgi:SnoaL-like polyketide cyclase
MEEVLLEKPSISETQRNVQAYFETHDVQYVTEDAVFTVMGSPDKYVGREAVKQLLNYFYHVAFDAKAEIKNTFISENKAFLEMDFVGKHIGEFAGLQATGKEVRVPLVGCYDLEDGFIKRGRIYMLGDVMYKQLTS